MRAARLASSAPASDLRKRRSSSPITRPGGHRREFAKRVDLALDDPFVFEAFLFLQSLEHVVFEKLRVFLLLVYFVELRAASRFDFGNAIIEQLQSLARGAQTTVDVVRRGAFAPEEFGAAAFVELIERAADVLQQAMLFAFGVAMPSSSASIARRFATRRVELLAGRRQKLFQFLGCSEFHHIP